jgi:hypothetical protein
MCDGQGFTAANQTLRYRRNDNTVTASGNIQGEDAAGAASVTLTGTTATSDWWGVIGVNISAAGGGARPRRHPPRSHRPSFDLLRRAVMAKVYQAHNYAQPTTAAPAPVTTGTAIKTLLQIATPSTEDLTVVAWGIDFDGTAAAAPIKVELIDTDVAATVTAHVASGMVKWNAPTTRLP